ncbi:MAG: hypothetical protein ACE5FD_18100, partial [Anaerolineae bacterium]
HRAGVIFFGSTAETAVPLTPLTDSDRRHDLFNRIADPPRMGWTDHLAALALAQSQLANDTVPSRPAIILLTDGKPEWANEPAAAEQAATAMAAQCIFLQMGSQLGQKGENAFDNLDEVLSLPTPDGQGTFLGSFGKGELVFDAPAVAGLCTRWLLYRQLQEAWLLPADTDVVTQAAESLLAGIHEERIRPLLLRDPETGGDLQNDLVQPAGCAKNRWATSLPKQLAMLRNMARRVLPKRCYRKLSGTLRRRRQG